LQLRFSESDLAFREEVRAFLGTLPPDLARIEAQWSHLDRKDYADWHRAVHARGWAAPLWPKALGGAGWSPVQKYIWEVEQGLANAPELSVIALNLVGPLICEFGTAEQHRRFLGPILRGELYFCQGFSEPGAGSDLASLRTRAKLDGEDWIITGQKVWTSHARSADFMICLARTNPKGKPQTSISMFLIPMDAPGVTVRAIDSIDGRRSVNEVFLDEVRVSARDILGEQDKAWSYTKFLLDNERTHNAYLGVLKRYLGRIERLVEGRSAALSARFHALEIDVTALEWSVLRVIAADAEKVSPAEASALKVRGSELLIQAGRLEMDLLGALALMDRDSDAAIAAGGTDESAPGKINQYMYWRAATIFGGSNEIQRTVIWNTRFRQERR
jgi:alkylation response protein AidB-like acyl-CoA dehydrogenase